MAADLSSQLTGAFENGDPGVLSAYLFGSQAEGRAHRDSDVDVGVLLEWGRYPTLAARFDARLRLLGDLGHALGRNDVDVVILNDAPPQLARAIVTRGIRVHCRDAAADHALVRTVMLRAADLEPFLRRLRRVKLAAIRR
jgi:predicted nucleotidyltransferase